MHETVVAIVTVMVYMLNKLVIRITTRLYACTVCVMMECSCMDHDTLYYYDSHVQYMYMHTMYMYVFMD